MGTFIRTFVFCLLVALAFIGYRMLSNESYNDDLSVSEKNPVFSHDKTYDDYKEPEKPKVEEPETYDYDCYFYTSGGKLTPVTRQLKTKGTLENIVALLLKGPTISESNQGIYSEIPKNVKLISVAQTPQYVIVNLDSSFGEGGGSDSIENRLKQLAKTVRANSDVKNVFLYIDNKQVEYLGGEGVFVKQPLD